MNSIDWSIPPSIDTAIGAGTRTSAEGKANEVLTWSPLLAYTALAADGRNGTSVRSRSLVPLPFEFPPLAPRILLPKASC